MDSDELMAVFRRISRLLQLMPEEDLVPLDAAIFDLSASFKKIFGEFVPALIAMTGNGPLQIGRLLDLLMDLKVEFEHVQSHLHEAIPVLEALMHVASRIEEEQTSGGKLN